MAHLIQLDKVGKSEIATVGGKGANLGELINAGFPVPGGFIATAGAYREHISQLDLTAYPAKVRQNILEQDIAAELKSEILALDDQLSASLGRTLVYAVRSSATAEDSEDASFAGQHDTYYYVTRDQLSDMVRMCWASLWSTAACSYRDSQGIAHHEVSMAVVVQEMIPSEVSGVTFTINPISGDTNEIVTDCSWGMGAAIVDGRVSPDHYTYDKSLGQLQSKRIADKRFMVPPTIVGSASRLVPVPPLQRRTEALNEQEVETLMALCLKVEAWFGAPQDIEWARFDNRFFLLQSRPVTRSGTQNDTIPAGKYVLFKPLAENFTDPLLPLTQDLFGRFPLMKVILGRLYLDLNHVRMLVPLKLQDHQLAQLAYLADDGEATYRISVIRSLLLMVILYINYLLMAVFYRRIDNLPNDFMDSYRQLFKKVVADDSVTPPEALARLFFKPRFFEPVGNMVMIINLAAPRYIFLMGSLTRLLKRWIPDLRADAASFLTAGTDDVLSTDMGHRIWSLADLARGYPEVVAIICQHDPKDALQELNRNPSAAKFLDELNRFLAIHGHRTLKEFELNSVRWEEDPTPVIAMVRNYLQSDINPQSSEQKVKIARADFSEEVRAKLEHRFLEKSFRWRWRLLSFLGDKARYLIRLRENSRFFHIMGFYAVRLKILSIEKRLLDKGVLKCRDDIFYLYWNEINQLVRGTLSWPDVETRIRERRMEYIRLSKQSPAKTYGIELPPVADSELTDQLRGQGASPGICEGIARVVMDPGTDAELKVGEILVAPYTDPAWTPLFLTASAAVVEVGSYLSHAGTIAREYGMPCVVDAADCTLRIKTGDRIRVDGTSGFVQLIQTPAPSTETSTGPAPGTSNP